MRSYDTRTSTGTAYDNGYGFNQGTLIFKGWMIANGHRNRWFWFFKEWSDLSRALSKEWIWRQVNMQSLWKKF